MSAEHEDLTPVPGYAFAYGYLVGVAEIALAARDWDGLEAGLKAIQRRVVLLQQEQQS